MAEFSNEEYLRALADNGDREAAKEYEQALDNRIFQLQISLAQTSDPQGRKEVQKLLEQEEKKKRDYFQEKEEKAVSEFRRRKNETTRSRKVSSFDRLRDPKVIRWVIGVVAVAAVVIPVVTLMWYSNNQNENVTNPWKNGQLAKSKEAAAASSDNQSSNVDTSSLSDQQLEDWVRNKAQQAKVIKIWVGMFIHGLTMTIIWSMPNSLIVMVMMSFFSELTKKVS